MEKDENTFANWLNIRSAFELRGAIKDSKYKLSLPEARQLTNHLFAIYPAKHALRLGIVHSYTSDLLDPWLRLEAALQGLELDVYHAPYGVNLQEARQNSGLVAHQPDLTVLLFRREDVHPELNEPIVRLSPDQQTRLRQQALDRMTKLLEAFRTNVTGQLALTLLPAVFPPALGLFDIQSERSEATWWTALKRDLAQHMKESLRSSIFLDLDDALASIGHAAFFDLKYWYAAQFPFAPEGAREVARRLMAVAASMKYPKVKVIAIDADNTLWGGVVGEDGIHGISLGPEYPGNAYLDFQRRLLAYQQRGFLLALCSKNNPADIDSVLRDHPHQVLRDEHFAARRVNWEPKPENLISLAEELNVGLDSFVLVDDSDHECAAVRHTLPQVEVVKAPSKPVRLPQCLDSIARLEILSLTLEDLVKTDLYARERLRRELKNEIDHSGGSLAEYLASLEMQMQIRLNDQAQVRRMAQLTQKTNQFNLTTRRYDEQDIHRFISASDWLVAHFSLTDVFGDAGIVGLALLRLMPDHAVLDTFLMSCRVIGREAECAFLHALLRHLLSNGLTKVYAEYLPTAKNALVKYFLPSHGFIEGPDGQLVRNLTTSPPARESTFPIAVTIEA